MDFHPKKSIQVDLEISEIRLLPGQTITVFCVPYPHQAKDLQQIELRMLANGEVEVYALQNQTVKSFDEWYEIKESEVQNG